MFLLAYLLASAADLLLPLIYPQQQEAHLFTPEYPYIDISKNSHYMPGLTNQSVLNEAPLDYVDLPTESWSGRPPAVPENFISTDGQLPGHRSSTHIDNIDENSSSTPRNRWESPSAWLRSDVNSDGMSVITINEAIPTSTSNPEPDEDDQYGTAEAISWLSPANPTGEVRHSNSSLSSPRRCTFLQLIQIIAKHSLFRHMQWSDLLALSSVSRSFEKLVHEYTLEYITKNITITVSTEVRVKWSREWLRVDSESETIHLYPITACNASASRKGQKLMFFGRRPHDQDETPAYRYREGKFSPSEIQLLLSIPGLERRYKWPLSPEDVNCNHSRFSAFRDVGITPFHCHKTKVSVFYKGDTEESSILYAVAFPISRLKKWFGMSPLELYMAGEASNS